MLISLNQSIDSDYIGSAFRIKDSEGTPKLSIDEHWFMLWYQRSFIRFISNGTFGISYVQIAPEGVACQQVHNKDLIPIYDSNPFFYLGSQIYTTNFKNKKGF